MQTDYEILIVGGGLAGATAAFHLAKTYKTLLIEDKVGASAIEIGLAHPLMGKKANPVYRIEEAFERLGQLLVDAKIPNCQTAIFRPVKDEEQRPYFIKNTQNYPQHGRFLPESPFAEIAAPLGGLYMEKGFSIEIPTYVKNLKQGIETKSIKITNFGVANGIPWIETIEKERISAKKLLLCLGSGYQHFEQLANLNLHQVLGQVISIDAPFPLLAALSGNGYVVQKGNRWHLGSSYEHFFTDTHPTDAQTQWILDKTRHLFKETIPINNLERQTGIRITIPRSILPVISPIPQHENCWLFSGLGSKGLLMSALLSTELEGYLFEQKTVPKELQFRTG